MPRARIYHIVYVESGFPGSTQPGGAGTYVQLIGRALVQQGYRVSVIAMNAAGVPGAEVCDGMRVYRPVAHGALHWYLAQAPGVRRAALAVRILEQGRVVAATLDRIHRRQPVDLVEFTEGGDFWHSWAAPFPFLCHLHGSAYTFKRLAGRPVAPGDWWQRRLELRMIARAAWVLSPARAMLQAVEAEYGRPFRRATVIPYPLDPHLLAGPAGGDRPDPDCRILFAARNDPVKGGDVLVQAAQRVAPAHPQVQFDLYGYEPTGAERAAVAAAGLDARVRFHPFVPKEELIRRYDRADVCVVPSRWDNSPNTVYEAMAAGKPVVASRVGGIPELVEDGVTGILVPPGDPAALAAALGRLAGDAGLRARMGAAGRARIRGIAGLECNVAARRAIYEQVIGEFRTHQPHPRVPWSSPMEESR